MIYNPVYPNLSCVIAGITITTCKQSVSELVNWMPKKPCKRVEPIYSQEH